MAPPPRGVTPDGFEKWPMKYPKKPQTIQQPTKVNGVTPRLLLGTRKLSARILSSASQPLGPEIKHWQGGQSA